ncbi:DUF397 domain-containing protein [Streptomyces sp. NBC_00996]|nr:DUF397 domain-containing protein [Streptomyces sp. NBC_00996]
MAITVCHLTPGGDQGSCVEVLDGCPTGVPVRDSKNPHGSAFIIKRSAWTSFVSALQGRTLGYE